METLDNKIEGPERGQKQVGYKLPDYRWEEMPREGIYGCALCGAALFVGISLLVSSTLMYLACQR